MSSPNTTRFSAGNQQGNSSEDGGDRYEIQVKGRLDPHWSGWLGGLEITYDPQGNTRLSGVIPDQAALFGILLRLRDLGATLLGLACLDVGSLFRPGGES